MVNDLGNREIMSENITKYLELYGMNQQMLADKLKISRATVSAWILKKSYPRIDMIEAMAEAFGCSKTDLVEKAGEKKQAYEMTSEEYMMLCLWRQVDDETRRMVARLLSSYSGNRL